MTEHWNSIGNNLYITKLNGGIGWLVPPGGDEMEEFVKKAVDTVYMIAEKGLHKNCWNRWRNDEINSAEVKETNSYIKVAAYMYSALWNIDETVAEQAVRKRGETYSRGNLTTVPETGKEILKIAEQMIGKEIRLKVSQQDVKEIIEHLFDMAAEKYADYENAVDVFASYMAVEEAIYNMVYHMKSGKPIDKWGAIRETAKDIMRQKNKQITHVECYLKRLEKRKK